MSENVRTGYTVDDFDWQYNNGISGGGLLLLITDEIIATQGMIPIKLVSLGNETTTVKSESSFLDPNYRGKGYFEYLYSESIDNCLKNNISVFWGFTALDKLWQNKLNFSVYNVFYESLIIISLKNNIRNIIYSKNKTKSKFFLIIKSIFRFIKQKRFPNNKHNIVVSEINYLAQKNRIKHIYETWMKYQKDNVFLSLNSFFLNWRLIENTKNKYNFLIFQENGKDVGFGIINIKNSLCYLVELIIVDEYCTNAILNSIINFTHQKNNISALSYLGNIRNKYNLTIFNAIKNAGVEPKELKEMKFVIKNHSNNINFENIDKYILNALWTEGFKI
jgi:GNAT superfamily N-acetyltransferase